LSLCSFRPAFDKAFRPPAGERVTFFDWPKKVTKEGHPNYRAPPGILPCGYRKRPVGSADGPSWTAADDAHPCASPAGLITGHLLAADGAPGKAGGFLPPEATATANATATATATATAGAWRFFEAVIPAQARIQLFGVRENRA
jgi:hypothetical protein